VLKNSPSKVVASTALFGGITVFSVWQLWTAITRGEIAAKWVHYPATPSANPFNFWLSVSVHVVWLAFVVPTLIAVTIKMRRKS
jgi:hypothetical protein